MAPPVPSGSAPLQFETNLAEVFERAQKTLAALARHEAAARRAFDKALEAYYSAAVEPGAGGPPP